MSSQKKNQALYVGLAVTAAALVAGYLLLKSREESGGKGSTKNKKKGVSDSKSSPPRATPRDATETTTPLVSNTSSRGGGPSSTDSQAEKEVHAKIEELDKVGKKLFKEKKYFEAAQTFSEALDVIETEVGSAMDSSSPLYRQMITLMNNRSAMYEKGSFKELALDDCDKILELDPKHAKARTRKLKILESQKDYARALVEVCAAQLVYMQENREKLRLGLPTPPPSIDQSKLESILMELAPGEVEKELKKIEEKPKSERSLPSAYTIHQLMRSYSGFNAWMAKVAKRGPLSNLQKDLIGADAALDDATKAQRASTLLKIGERHVYDGAYDKARTAVEEAYALVDGNDSVQKQLTEDDYPRILEWAGMVRHWIYDLEGARKCFTKCAELEPMNAEIVVKQACVEMDGSKYDKADKLFDSALKIDPGAADAFLHRANLKMLQQKAEEAKKDFERCIELRPDHILARLRLASIFTATEKVAEAKKQLEAAKKLDPNSSEIESYYGEIAFTRGELAEAQEHFTKAISLAPNNPTPYVNSALTVLNTPPPPGQIPDTAEAIRLLEKAIEADPQFHAAYVQLGQLKLGTALTIDAAQEVVALYDKALQYCRTADELKDLCSMRILTIAQVEAATNLKMDTFNMQ